MREAERAAVPPAVGEVAPVVETGAIPGAGGVATIAAAVLEAAGAAPGPGVVRNRPPEAPVVGVVAAAAAAPAGAGAATDLLRCGTRERG